MNKQFTLKRVKLLIGFTATVNKQFILKRAKLLIGFTAAMAMLTTLGAMIFLDYGYHLTALIWLGLGGINAWLCAVNFRIYRSLQRMKPPREMMNIMCPPPYENER